jgi:hypothetical protein
VTRVLYLCTEQWSHGLAAVEQDGCPLKFHSVGQDFFAGSHYDEYLYEWTSYKPGPVDPSVFDLPDPCKTQRPQGQHRHQDAAGTEAVMGQERHFIALQALALLPGNHREHKGKPQVSSCLIAYTCKSCGCCKALLSCCSSRQYCIWLSIELCHAVDC